jgi:uncharacterized protein with PIN domain
MKFLLTKELGRLSKWLRILGFDASYFTQDKPASLIIQALREDRVILTRNHRLPKSGGAKIIIIQAEMIREQLVEVLKTLKIKLNSDMMFTRCIICNEELLEIDKLKVKDQVPEYVYKTQERFINCPKCGRIYWQGTHWGNVSKILKEIAG